MSMSKIASAAGQSGGQPPAFHEVAAQQLEQFAADDEATPTIALLHTLAKVQVPRSAHTRLREALYQLWEVTAFQEWIEESGVADRDVQVVSQLIRRFGGVTPPIPEYEEAGE